MNTKEAILTKNVTYYKDGRYITWEKDTIIKVDCKENVGMKDGDHVDIFEEEFKIVTFN